MKSYTGGAGGGEGVRGGGAHLIHPITFPEIKTAPPERSDPFGPPTRRSIQSTPPIHILEESSPVPRRRLCASPLGSVSGGRRLRRSRVRIRRHFERHLSRHLAMPRNCEDADPANELGELVRRPEAVVPPFALGGGAFAAPVCACASAARRGAMERARAWRGMGVGGRISGVPRCRADPASHVPSARAKGHCADDRLGQRRLRSLFCAATLLFEAILCYT